MDFNQLLSITVSTANFYAIWLILSLSLNYEYGYTGILNFGKVLFFSLGAYASGFLAANMANLMAGVSVDICSVEAVQLRLDMARAFPHMPFLLFTASLVLGASLSAAVAYLLYLSTSRIKEGFVLGIVLLAAGETSRIVVRNYEPVVCGYHGLVGIPNPYTAAGDPTTASYLLSITIWIIAGLTFVFINRLTSTPYGRKLKAIRDNELAADIYGKKPSPERRKVLMIGSAMAGVAGVLYAYYLGFVAADDFTSLKTFDIWVAVMLGGVGNHLGAVVGSLAVTLIDRGTRMLRGFLATLSIPLETLYLRWIIVGVLMLLILLYRPAGIFPEKSIKTPGLLGIIEKIRREKT